MADDETGETLTSVLGTKEYWDNLYDRSERAFDESRDPGDVWFGEQAGNKVVKWIRTHVHDRHLPILDVGCGNGHILVGLARRGYDHLVGIDYSEPCIRLAEKATLAALAAGPDSDASSNDDDDDDGNAASFPATPTFRVVDLLQPPHSEMKARFAVAVDKGTFDAIALGGDAPKQAYVRCLPAFMRPCATDRTETDASQRALLVLTSCNWTGEQLDAVFHPAGYTTVGSIPHPTFRFGGVVGQTVTTRIYAFPPTPPS